MNTALNYQPEVLVDTADLSREDWLDYRRLGIGGSDAAAIMGLSPFSTIRDLYFDKIGVTPVIEEEEENWVAKEVGHRLEDLVAMIFAKKTGLEVFPVRKMFRHPLYPFMLADVDYFIRFPDGSIGILECKTCNYNAKDKWAYDGIPENYVLQVRHYLAVMNMNKAYIACLYGNNENEFVYRCLERDRMEEEELIDQEKYFWEEYVEKKIEPPYSGKPDLILASIRKYNGYADKSIPEISISSLESRSLEKYLKLSEEKSQLEKRKKKIEAEQRALSVPFVELLGQGCKAVIEDGSFRYRITYNPTIRTQIGKENMEKLKISIRISTKNTQALQKAGFSGLKGGCIMLQGKKAYICSPLSAPNPEGMQHNMELAKYYFMQMKRLYHCRTFASHAHLPLMLDDRIPEERETAMQIGALMLDLCEVLIICGSCISEGMRREIQTAFEKGKDVYWYDSKMKSGELMKVENWRSIDDEVQIYT